VAIQSSAIKSDYSSKMNQVQVLEAPVKSEGDKKDYRLVKLPNGLKALLIHVNADSSEESESK
jgi:secreted Zn-dependent insulinase-like peptidase